MKPDITMEITFKTARSGGSGGQNVNKVETMVEGRWNIGSSLLVSEDQKHMIFKGLANRITSEGLLLVKSQAERSQLGNKLLVIAKMNDLVAKALIKKKSRIATKASKASKERRIESKKQKSEIKGTRGRLKPGSYGLG